MPETVTKHDVEVKLLHELLEQTTRAFGIYLDIIGFDEELANKYIDPDVVLHVAQEDTDKGVESLFAENNDLSMETLDLTISRYIYDNYPLIELEKQIKQAIYEDSMALLMKSDLINKLIETTGYDNYPYWHTVTEKVTEINELALGLKDINAFLAKYAPTRETRGWRGEAIETVSQELHANVLQANKELEHVYNIEYEIDPKYTDDLFNSLNTKEVELINDLEEDEEHPKDYWIRYVDTRYPVDELKSQLIATMGHDFINLLKIVLTQRIEETAYYRKKPNYNFWREKVSQVGSITELKVYLENPEYFVRDYVPDWEEE